MRGRIGITKSGLSTVIPGSDLITSFARQDTISKDAKKRLRKNTEKSYD